MTVSTSWSKHTVHSPFLTLEGSSGAESEGETGGLRGELGAVTREDSEAEEDLLTLKARSESLSSGLLPWELPGDVDGGLDCIVPVTERNTQTHTSTNQT